MIAGDSWNAVMYRTMENTSPIAALFFVALVVLGEVSVKMVDYIDRRAPAIVLYLVDSPKHVTEEGKTSAVCKRPRPNVVSA